MTHREDIGDPDKIRKAIEEGLIFDPNNLPIPHMNQNSTSAMTNPAMALDSFVLYCLRLFRCILSGDFLLFPLDVNFS
jgi:hypothetical protein